MGSKSFRNGSTEKRSKLWNAFHASPCADSVFEPWAITFRSTTFSAFSRWTFTMKRFSTTFFLRSSFWKSFHSRSFYWFGFGWRSSRLRRSTVSSNGFAFSPWPLAKILFVVIWKRTASIIIPNMSLKLKRKSFAHSSILIVDRMDFFCEWQWRRRRGESTVRFLRLVWESSLRTRTTSSSANWFPIFGISGNSNGRFASTPYPNRLITINKRRCSTITMEINRHWPILECRCPLCPRTVTCCHRCAFNSVFFWDFPF